MIKLALASVLSFSAFGCGMLMPAGQTTQPGAASSDPTALTSAVENPASPAPTAPAPAHATDTPKPATATVVSVTLRSSCKDTVRVFYGKKPKFGSGTTSSISANSVQSKSMQPGEMVWIVDQSDNGIASATVSESTKTIEVDASCTSLR